MEQPKILVAIRKRPLSKKEIGRGETDTVAVKNDDTVIVTQHKQKVDLTKFLEETIFNFDFAFHEEAQNQEVYDMAVRPLVDSAFQGAKVTCFAYGQTGSGKTHTMNGNMNQGIPGLYTLGANDIFQYLASPQFRHLKAKLSFYEIYCGKLYDLLNKRNQLKLREDNKNNINIIGLEEAPLSSSQQFLDCLLQGSKERITSQNSANADSSRSHAILQISLKDGKKLFGKISFIDLAGNERGADHMDMGKQTRIDGAEINKSLLSLKQCIRALDQGKGHTPFRGSKLTMVLKDSFIGFCRTVMIGNVSPSSASSENTLNTLRYADRVKELRKPQDSGTKEEKMAREMMLPRQNKNAIRIMIDNDDDAEDIAEKRDRAQREYGIVEEQPQANRRPPVKEDLSARKNSFNTAKVQPKVEGKSTSVNKNHVGNSLSGHRNTMGSVNLGSQGGQPQLMTSKGVNNNAKRGGQVGSPELPSNLQRYNSQQYGKKEEQMEVESPYYMPSSKGQGSSVRPGNNNNNNSRLQHNPVNPSQVNNNHSGVAMNNSGMYNQRSYQQQQPGYNQGPPQQQYNHQGPYNQGPPQYSQGPPQGYGQPQKNNYFNQQQQPQQYQKGGNYPVPPQQPVQYEIPSDWQQMAMSVGTVGDPDYTVQVLTQMNEHLFTEEEELIKNHSDSLRREIDIIKSEMSQLNEMEIDRSKTTSRGYVQFMQEGIDEKISLLEELKERLISFTYKLDTIEELEGKGTRGSVDDEQLLDDINY